MTEAELAALEAEIERDPTLLPGEVARYMALVAEVRWLRGLVEQAYEEGRHEGGGQSQGGMCVGDYPESWSRSDARKALDGTPKPPEGEWIPFGFQYRRIDEHGRPCYSADGTNWVVGA